MTLSPEVLAAVTITAGVGFAMTRLALRKGFFEARVDSRRCVSCGHIIKARSCPQCSRSSASR